MGIVEELPTTLEDLRCKGVTESKAPTITVSEIDEDTLPTKDVVSECKGLGKSSATTITVSEIHEDSLSVRDHVPKPEVLVVANDSVLQDASTIKFGTVLCTLVLIVFMAAMDFTIVSTAVPDIMDEFDSLHDVEWYGTSFFIMTATVQPLWGRLYSIFSLKAVYLWAIVLFEVGSLLCGLAPSSTALIVGRALCGTGAAGLFSGSYAIIADLVLPGQRPKYTGLIGAVFGIASAVGPLFGGALTSAFTWRWCFYINLPIGGVATICVVIFLTNSTLSKGMDLSWYNVLIQLDIFGLVLIISALVCYALSMQWAGVTYAWSSGEIIGTLVGSVVLLSAFALNEYHRGDNAMLARRSLRHRTILVGATFSSLLTASFIIVLYYLPIYFQTVQGVTAAKSGVRTLAYIVPRTVCVVLAGVGISVFGHGLPFMVLGALLTVIGTALLYTLDADSTAAESVGYQVLGGVGTGLSFQVPIMLAQTNSKKEDIASVTATILFFQLLGNAVGLPAAQAAFQTMLPTESLDGVMEADMAAIKGAFLLAIAFAGAAFVSLLGFNASSSKRSKLLDSQDTQQSETILHVTHVKVYGARL